MLLLLLLPPPLPQQEIAATCLFLACKLEESLRRTSDIIKVVTRVALKKPTLAVDENSKVSKYY